MTREEWNALYDNSREEAWLLPDRKHGIAFDLIRSLAAKVFELEDRLEREADYRREQNERNT